MNECLTRTPCVLILVRPNLWLFVYTNTWLCICVQTPVCFMCCSVFHGTLDSVNLSCFRSAPQTQYRQRNLYTLSPQDVSCAYMSVNYAHMSALYICMCCLFQEEFVTAEEGMRVIHFGSTRSSLIFKTQPG